MMMASLCQSNITLCYCSPPNPLSSASSSSALNNRLLPQWKKTTMTMRMKRSSSHVVRMAPDEEKMTRRSPLEFPSEWESNKSGRRADIIPQFSPMKTPLPPPLPSDPPEEDEFEEKEEGEGEGEEDEENPEDPDNTERQ